MRCTSLNHQICNLKRLDPEQDWCHRFCTQCQSTPSHSAKTVSVCICNISLSDQNCCNLTYLSGTVIVDYLCRHVFKVGVKIIKWESYGLVVYPCHRRANSQNWNSLVGDNFFHSVLQSGCGVQEITRVHFGLVLESIAKENTTNKTYNVVLYSSESLLHILGWGDGIIGTHENSHIALGCRFMINV